MKSAVVLAPLRSNLVELPNEAQQVVNQLSAAGYRVNLIQNPVTRLELAHAVDDGPFDLCWVGTDSGEKGFALSKDEWISPGEFGEFCLEAGFGDAVLNSCYSAQHVDAIRLKSPQTNIVATIVPTGIADTDAWSAALYLVRRFVRLNSLREAARSAGPQYKWFAAIEAPVQMNTDTPDSRQNEIRFRRIESALDQMTRALQGEAFSGQPGLIETMRKSAEADEKWKREMEAQFETLRDDVNGIRSGRDGVVMSAKTATFIVFAGTLFVVLVLVLTRLLAG